MQTAILSKFALKRDLHNLASKLKNEKYKNWFCIFEQDAQTKMFVFFSNSAKKDTFNIYITL